MNVHGHGWDKLFWIYPSDDLCTFSALASVLSHLVVSGWRVVLSSNFPAETRAVVIFPSRFFIRRFYSNFINRFCCFHAFKYVYVFFKVMYSQSNPYIHTCLLQLLGMLFKNKSFNSVSKNCHLPLPQGTQPNTR